MTQSIGKTILAAALIFPFTVVMSQVSFGVKGGMNVNHLVMSNVPDNFPLEKHSSLGYHVGVFSKMKLSDKFSLIPELQFIQKGYKLTDKIPTSSYELHFNISYLELPLMVSYSPVKLLNLELGPTVALRLRTKVISEVNTDGLEDAIEDFEIGLTGGLRFNLSEKFSLAGRYYHGLSAIDNITVIENGVAGKGSDMYNRNVQLSLCYVLKQLN